MTEDTPPLPRRRRARKPALIALLLLGLAAALLLSTSPTAPATTLSARKAQSARSFIENTKLSTEAGDARDTITIAPDWEQFDALVTLAGHMLDRPHVMTFHENDGVTVAASKPLFLGLWFNMEMNARPGDEGETEYGGKIGRVPIGDIPMRAIYGLVRQVWHPRETQLPEWESLKRDVVIDREGLEITIDAAQFAAFWHYGGNAEAQGAKSRLASEYYCALVAQRRANPTRSLAEMVNRAFSSEIGRDHPDVTLVALAMIARAPHIEYLTGGTVPDTSACGTVPALQLDGRMDLAKHWTISAALAARVDADADAIGVWKEIADSDGGGSGFSYFDLAADMSGVHVGRALRSEETRSAAIAMLAEITDEDLLPVHDLRLQEGLSEAEFLHRYGGLEGERHKAVTRSINRAIQNRLNFRTAPGNAS